MRAKSSPDVESVYARVVKLVDTRDLKSLGGNAAVPVRLRPRAPHCVIHHDPTLHTRPAIGSQAEWLAGVHQTKRGAC